MAVALCRQNLNLTSGAGPLIRQQAEALRAAGERVEVYCRRGGFKFFLNTRLPVRRASPARLQSLAASPAHVLVDHGMRLAAADLLFVHNLYSEALRHLEREDWRARAAAEAAFFRELGRSTLIVANSELVRRALLEHFELPPGQVRVERPGYRSARFSLARAPTLRAAGRRALRLEASEPLVGFVTSGDFAKRGLDVFLEAAERLAAVRPEARFLVVGSKRLPASAAAHPLVSSGRLLYRPKSARPEPWFAALDVFLYPARFEEFGLVVTEALALGIPVLTSRRVGASECLPPAYAPWLLEAPHAARFAELALALLDDAGLRRELAHAGAEQVAQFDEKRYVRETVELILKSARAKPGGGGSYARRFVP